MPNSRLEVFAETGHFPHESNPEQFLNVLEHFLHTTQPASYSSAEWREVLRRGPPDRRPASLAH